MSLDDLGYLVLLEVYSSDEMDDLVGQLEQAFAAENVDPRSIRTRAGTVFAARNVESLLPASCDLWRRPPLLPLLRDTLGPECGLVRVLYFDKPPDRTWTLPWHRDLTVAVQRNDLPSAEFRNPTRKAGVAHVEAPRWLLESMLTLRIHLDTVTHENGPLMVLPGSHRADADGDGSCGAPLAILAGRGDVLAMRPLLSHSSGHAAPGNLRHRRVLHLEFAARPALPDGYAWNFFKPQTAL